MTQILFVFPRPRENSLELIYLGVPANPYCGDSTLASHRLGSERDWTKLNTPLLKVTHC